jgi:hypothetical protein
MILNIFFAKILATKLAIWAQTAAIFCRNVSMTSIFEKNANFFNENFMYSSAI